MEDQKKLINWKQLSLLLSGSDNSIRKNNIPKKYSLKINSLLEFIKKWEKDTNK